MDIIKTNNMLKTQVQAIDICVYIYIYIYTYICMYKAGAPEGIVMEFSKLLQYHIYTLNDNTIIGAAIIVY